MISLTKKEREALVILFKDFTNYYNANFISKILNISHVGAQKILKRLCNDKILKSEKIGKSITYKLRLEDDYTYKLISLILTDEAKKHERWTEEFKDLFKNGRILAVFGSIIKNYEKARDIDIMIIADDNIKEINKIIKQKKGILPKEIHAIIMTSNDLTKNIKKRDKVVIDIIKNAIILYGQDRYINIIKNVTSI